jgi:hypothetical protein
VQGLRRSGVIGPASESAHRLWRGLTNYIASPDPRAAAANRVAVLVALNQPFYPLYIRAFVGDDGWVSAVTFLSTPFFAVIPAVTKRSPLIGRAMLPLVGAANTMLTAKAFGAASGVELFLFPCAMAAAMAFRATERSAMLAVLAALAAAYFGLHDRWAPWHTFSSDAYAHFLTMNIVSVAGLVLLIALQFSGADESAAS